MRRGGENYVKEQERVFKLAFRKSPDMDITIDCRWFTR